LTPDSKKYLSVEEVAKRYDGLISVRTLNNWRTQGNGPAFVKLGGKVAYPLDKLIEWEAKQTVNSTSEYRS